MPLETEKISSVLVLMIDRHLGNLVISLSAIAALQQYFHNKTCYFAFDIAYREVIEGVKG